MTEDITDVFKSTRTDCLVLSKGFPLAQAVSCIDIGDPKMDRAMCQVDGVSLWEVYENIMKCQLPSSPIAQSPTLPPDQLTDYISLVNQLIGSWLNGKSATGTILTALFLHQEPDLFCIADERLLWIVQANLRCCYLISDIIQLAGVYCQEDFSPHLHGILNKVAVTTEAEELLSSYSQIFPQKSKTINSDIWMEASRVCMFLRFLHQVRFGRFDYDGMLHYLQKLSSISLLCRPPTGRSLNEVEKEIFRIPQMVNFYNTGCYRDPPSISSPEQCCKQWNSLGTVMRGSSVYGYYESGQYAKFTFGGQLPLNIEALMIDAIQITCHAPARQRRIIPKYLNALNLHTKGVEDKIGSISIWMALWYVILGFQLDLYEPYEQMEAHWMIQQLLLKSIYTNTASHLNIEALYQINEQYLSFNGRSTHNSHLHVYTNCRYYHRWKCLQNVISIETPNIQQCPLNQTKSNFEIFQEYYPIMLNV